MKKCTIASMLVLSALVFACKKDKDKTPQELILGKWTLVKRDWIDYDANGGKHPGSKTGTAQDVVEFTNNGYLIEDGDTTTYKLIDGPKLIIDGDDTTSILSITDSELKTYSTDTWSTGWSEDWATFKK